MNCGHVENPLTEVDRRLQEATLFLLPSEDKTDDNRHLYLPATHMRESLHEKRRSGVASYPR